MKDKDTEPGESRTMRKARKRKEEEPSRHQVSRGTDSEITAMIFNRVHHMFPNLPEEDPLFQKRLIADLRQARVVVPEGATLLSKDL